MTEIRKILIISLFVFLASAFIAKNFVADSEQKFFGRIQLNTKLQKINMEKNSIQLLQNTENLKRHKYKQLKQYSKNGVKYKVDEYVTPRGEAGYQIIIDDGETIESVGYGRESKERTFIIKHSTSTTR